MRIVTNTAADSVSNALASAAQDAAALDVLTPRISLHALGKILELLPGLQAARIVAPEDSASITALLGDSSERPERAKLLSPHIARKLAAWLQTHSSVKLTTVPVQQPVITTKSSSGSSLATLTGQCPLTLKGIGLLPADPFSLVQGADNILEHETFASWFEASWNQLHTGQDDLERVLASLKQIAADHPPSSIYAACLEALFGNQDFEQTTKRLARAGTGFGNSLIWNKLYRFQRDAVTGILEKLDRFGGCIVADSVGLGKTFEALAVVKYYENQSDRVLVLCPKRLRENWTLYTSNSDRNILADDNFRYKVLHHTDLSRDSGTVGDIDLKGFIWSNFDLVVIDESHNFRNKKSPRQDGLTRYDHLMQKIIQDGAKTRVLMLSATPVNNRLADLRNQIAFITENDDKALSEYGINSIDATVRKAQAGFNEWQKGPTEQRNTAELVRMLGFDYFKLLDSYTIARSRKHIEKYYGTEETGVFPARLTPINHRVCIDALGEFPEIKEINSEIRKLHLAAYAPLNYVLPSRKAFYDEKYSTKLKGNKGIFRQSDREQSLIHLMRVNLLKRMESSVESFRLTVERQLASVQGMLDKIQAWQCLLRWQLPP